MKKTRAQRSWTNEMIAGLKDMWASGMNTKLIADKLGITKNSVIGKASYLGLTRRESKTFVTQDGNQSKTKKKADNSPKMSKYGHQIPANSDKFQMYKPMAHTPLAGLIPKELVDLKERECRWPFGHSPDLVFCGGRCKSGKPYCETHYEISRRTLRNDALEAPEEIIEDEIDIREVG